MGISRKSNSSRESIKIILFTEYKLIRNHLALLLESKSEIDVLDFASNPGELLQKVSKLKPDVVLFCLMDNEVDNIEVMPKMF
jgi:DNA-binding NarL/FixJ family response regulator